MRKQHFVRQLRKQRGSRVMCHPGNNANEPKAGLPMCVWFSLLKGVRHCRLHEEELGRKSRLRNSKAVQTQPSLQAKRTQTEPPARRTSSVAGAAASSSDDVNRLIRETYAGHR